MTEDMVVGIPGAIKKQSDPGRGCVFAHLGQ